MNRFTFIDVLLLKHTTNTCLFFGKPYHIQSRATQRAGILKRYGVEVPAATFDRAIRRVKDRALINKIQRSGQVTGQGNNWKTSVTSITWGLVIYMWRLGELTKEQFGALKRIFGMVKKRGPAKLRATPTPQSTNGEEVWRRPSLFPT